MALANTAIFVGSTPFFDEWVGCIPGVACAFITSCTYTARSLFRCVLQPRDKVVRPLYVHVPRATLFLLSQYVIMNVPALFTRCHASAKRGWSVGSGAYFFLLWRGTRGRG